jgi:segregation and condensation protein A
MGATLMHIKSRMLLPQESLALEEGGEMDPRADLVRQLLEYKRYKEVALKLESKELYQREVYWRVVGKPAGEEETPAEDEPMPEFQEVNLFDLLTAFKQVLAYARPETFREIDREEFKTSQKINEILDLLEQNADLEFVELIRQQTSRLAMVTTFLAILELARLKAICIVQAKIFDPIVIRRLDEFAASARAALAGVEE